MSVFSSYKKIFLLGFIVVILVAIPFSVYFAQQRQQTKIKASKSTTLSFEPASVAIKVGDTLILNVMLDPGAGASANQVSFVKLSISFDPLKFTTLSDSLKANLESSNTLTTVIDDSKYESGKAILSLSVGADPTKAVTTKTKIAILKLKAAAATVPTEPNITFDSAPNTQVLSIASLDQASENVLSTTNPATITISSAATSVTPTPSLSPTATPSALLSSPAPGTAPKNGKQPPTSSLAPACSSLEVNGLTTGTAPYSLAFTATGNDTDGTIRKISFNFGDSIEDLIGGDGIGTSSVSAQITHTYRTPGIYTAYAILTDNNDNLSVQQSSCTKTITINSEPSQPFQPSPTISQPGDGKIMLGLGALGIIFTIIGGVLLFL